MDPPFPDPHLDAPWTDRGGTRREAEFANAVASAVSEHYGWMPHGARYGAADAAIRYLREILDAAAARLNSLARDMDDPKTRQLYEGEWTEFVPANKTGIIGATQRHFGDPVPEGTPDRVELDHDPNDCIACLANIDLLRKIRDEAS